MSREDVQKIRMNADRWFSDLFGYGAEGIPKEGDNNVAGFIEGLWKESKDWRIKSFDNRLDYNDPFVFWRDCRKVEEGMHWEVWGRRNTGDEDKWKQELVDDEIANHIRVRKSYLTANWHDITILPNIKDISTIIDQERAKTEWGDCIAKGVHRGLTEGMAVWKSILDKSVETDGLAREILIDNAGLFPTPYSYGISKLDGTWYLIHATLQSEQQIREAYPDADEQNFTQMQEDIAKYLRLDLDNTGPEKFGHTKLIPVLECYMDDPHVIRADSDPEEIALEHDAFKNGIAPDVTPEQNHVAHVEEHLAFLEMLHSVEPGDEEEAQLRDSITQLMGIHIEEHRKEGEKKKLRGQSPGVTDKYPFGRKIVVAGGVVLDDAPHALAVDWRRVFHVWYCEKLPHSWWGRGVAEILWNTNKVEDTMLSRSADIAISIGVPKMYFNTTDKDAVEEQGLDNDPLKPAFVSAPPAMRQGTASPDNMLIYTRFKENATKAQSISGISYGQAPSAQASGKLVENLLAQNQVVITGEANQRLSDTIENIVEMRIEMYKRFYTEPRFYFMNGIPKALTLSDIFSKFVVVNEQGEREEKNIPMFQVTVRQNSNFPSRFEYELQFLLQLSQTPSPDGTPIVPREAILDVLGNTYPKLARDGEYYKMSEALQRGLQAMAQEQAAKEDEAKTLRTIGGKIRNRGIKELLNPGSEIPIQGGENGGRGQ